MQGSLRFLRAARADDPEAQDEAETRGLAEERAVAASQTSDTGAEAALPAAALGDHPESGKPVEANIGRFGPYVKHDGSSSRFRRPTACTTSRWMRAVELLAEKKAARRRRQALGIHPEDKSRSRCTAAATART